MWATVLFMSFDESTSKAEDRMEGAALPSSLLNGFRILECFTVSEPDLGVTEVSRILCMHKSTVSRMMNGLQSIGYLQRDEQTDKYRLGTALLTLASPLLANLDVRTIAHPFLVNETKRTNETSAIAVIEDFDPIVVDQVPSPKLVKHTQEIGTRYRGWSSASVRLSLAFRESEEAHEIIKSGRVEGLPDSDGAGMRSAYEELADIRDKGYAMNNGQSDPLEFSLAAPVFDINCKLSATVISAAPLSRITEDRFTLIRENVMSDAREISIRLGCSLDKLTMMDYPFMRLQ